ncbi:MAG: CHAT domain-containing protein [Anaerolineae bacterium]|nr:CHAT domain-containing protein [Anaerolineae bacterium]
MAGQGGDGAGDGGAGNLCPPGGAGAPDPQRPPGPPPSPRCPSTRRRWAGGAVYALDRFTFAYVPSAQALYHARLAVDRPADSLLAVRYPDPRFQYADHAVDAALDLFPPEKRQALRMEEARRKAVRAAFRDASVLFFTHGQADFDQPLRSGLLMADGKWLTLEDIYDLRSERARLAVLAACETGLPSDLRNIEEVVSLPSGLMQAGVPGVVGSLWSVLEASTALLMTLFFEYWRTHGLSPPQALRRAQQILRNGPTNIEARQVFRRYLMPREAAEAFHIEMRLRDFTHPFYWAAFTYTGV